MAQRDWKAMSMLQFDKKMLWFLVVFIVFNSTTYFSLLYSQIPNKTESDRISNQPLFEFIYVDERQQETKIQAAQLLEAQDGGVVMLTRDGRLLTATPQQLKKKRPLDQNFSPLKLPELKQQLVAEFGSDFTVTQTKHFTVCSQAGKRYSKWCGYLFERLYNVLHNHWDSKSLPLHDPEVPLIAVIFKDRANFEQYASQVLGNDNAAVHGFYSTQSNRMMLYDLTASPNESPAHTDADILRKLSKSPFNVATVIHECTHQIAFNVGLHTRFADNPLWLTEGMATYFETPDLRSKTGWRTVGKPNPWRLRQFQNYVGNRRTADSLQTLIMTDQRFLDPETVLDSYAEAWAFSYFLIKTKRKLYKEYLALIASKKPLIWSTPEDRLKDFQSVFGDDLSRLNQQFLKYLRQIRR